MITLAIQAFFKVVSWPAWVHVGLLSAVLFVGMQWKHTREVHQLEAQIAGYEQTIQSKDASIANLHISVTQERLNVSTLTAQVREQNHAILLMQAKAKEAETEASIAAVRAFNDGRAAAEKLRQPTTTIAPGHAAMNDWLAERVK